MLQSADASENAPQEIGLPHPMRRPTTAPAMKVLCTKQGHSGDRWLTRPDWSVNKPKALTKETPFSVRKITQIDSLSKKNKKITRLFFHRGTFSGPILLTKRGMIPGSLDIHDAKVGVKALMVKTSCRMGIITVGPHLSAALKMPPIIRFTNSASPSGGFAMERYIDHCMAKLGK